MVLLVNQGRWGWCVSLGSVPERPTGAWMDWIWDAHSTQTGHWYCKQLGFLQFKGDITNKIQAINFQNRYNNNIRGTMQVLHIVRGMQMDMS
jgi:hypothetical protein